MLVHPDTGQRNNSTTITEHRRRFAARRPFVNGYTTKTNRTAVIMSCPSLSIKQQPTNEQRNRTQVTMYNLTAHLV